MTPTLWSILYNHERDQLKDATHHYFVVSDKKIFLCFHKSNKKSNKPCSVTNIDLEAVI